MKKLIVFLFLFTVLDRTGINLISLHHWKFEKSNEVFELESASKESEKKDNNSVKEFWICSVFQSLVNPALKLSRNQTFINNITTEHTFYPSVPTPPPNIMSFI